MILRKTNLGWQLALYDIILPMKFENKLTGEIAKTMKLEDLLFIYSEVLNSGRKLISKLDLIKAYNIS